MAQYIDKAAVVAEIERRIKKFREQKDYDSIVKTNTYKGLLYSFIDTLEGKGVNLMIHTIIAECCNWLTRTTDLSHDEIEDCRNFMLTVKKEQCKARKGGES